MGIPVNIDAVVFGCDGLLAGTEPGWTRAEAGHREPYHPAGVIPGFPS